MMFYFHVIMDKNKKGEKIKMINKINEAASYIQEHLPFTPKIAIILGSGLGPLANTVEDPIILDYQNIPHFPKIGRASCRERV